jgi:hypothetical protein
MVIIVHIDRWDISKILVDNGSQAEILFYGFNGKRIEPIGVITLPVLFGTP